MKRLLGLILGVLVVGLLLLSGCSNGNGTKSESADPMKKIGIVQIVEHPSLNTIRETLIDRMAEKGMIDGQNITIDYQNAQNDQTNLKTIAQKFANGNYDLIIAIATPSAQVAAGQTQTIPVLFSACTDPLGSGLVADLNKPGKNVTGTSDAVSAEQIMQLALRITPDIRTVGALYTSSETNSISVVNDLKEYAGKNGMTVIEATVTNSSEVQQAAQSLVGKVDAIFSPIDNTIASAMPVAVEIANKSRVPFYVGADSMVKDGGLATCGVNYVELGQQTGDMAVEILNGANPGDMPVRKMNQMEIYLNQDTASAIGIVFPEDVIQEASEIFKK